MKWLCSFLGSILDQLINHPIGDKIRNYWRRYWSDSRHVTDHDSEFSAIVQATIDALWPTNQFVAIFEYLIVTEQYECLLVSQLCYVLSDGNQRLVLQDLCEKLETHCDELKFSRIFVQGYSLLHLGQPREVSEHLRLEYKIHSGISFRRWESFEWLTRAWNEVIRYWSSSCR